MNRRPGVGVEGFSASVEHLRADINPYVERHLHFGPELIPAEDARGFRGRWGDAFPAGDQPLHLELGAGSGIYLAEMARRNPTCNWLGLELRFKRVDAVARRLRAAGVSNARIMRYSWFYLDELFTPGTIAGLHLNHPDPWPKRRQARHRIIDPAFVAQMATLLLPGAEWRLKTDFPPHVEALEEAIAGQPFEVLGRSTDLRVQGAPWPDDVETAYQGRANAMGVAVWGLRLRRL